MDLKIAIILGTRPEIIKMSPIIRECEKQGLEHYILHTNQHYSHEMDCIFFEELELPQPRYNVDAGANIIDSLGSMMDTKGWENPYGDASKLIVDKLLNS